MYAVDPGIRCLTGSHHRLCGPVCTVKLFPGDNLMVHKVLDVAKPGDVVVIDSRGSTMNAVLGDLISTKARHRKIAGFVIDGLVRDLPDIIDLGDFPVFARGTTSIGPLHRGPGEINYPICCGGTVVYPGDLVVADAAGIVVVPQNIVEEVLDRLKSHRTANAAYLAGVQRGDFSNQWVDGILQEHGCPIIKEELWQRRRRKRRGGGPTQRVFARAAGDHPLEGDRSMFRLSSSPRLLHALRWAYRLKALLRWRDKNAKHMERQRALFYQKAWREAAEQLGGSIEDVGRRRLSRSTSASAAPACGATSPPSTIRSR